MWVVNPSEEEENKLIYLRDVVPGATSAGQLVWKHGSRVLPSQGGVAEVMGT